MTVLEFCDKYGVDYATVYGATYKVKQISTGCKNRRYDENELLCAVRDILKSRVDRHRMEMEKAEKLLEKCKM